MKYIYRYHFEVFGCQGVVSFHAVSTRCVMSTLQEASARLYLAVLLRRRPLLTEGVVMGLNGARFLDVYIPDIGTELRIQVEDIAPAPVYGDWDAKAKYALCCRSAQHLFFAPILQCMKVSVMYFLPM